MRSEGHRKTEFIETLEYRITRTGPASVRVSAHTSDQEGIELFPWTSRDGRLNIGTTDLGRGGPGIPDVNVASAILAHLHQYNELAVATHALDFAAHFFRQRISLGETLVITAPEIDAWIHSQHSGC